MTAHDAFEPAEPIALQAAWGARLTPGAPPIRHAAPPVRPERLRSAPTPPWMPLHATQTVRPASPSSPPSPLSNAETVQHDEPSGEVTAELPLLLNPHVAPPTYQHSELAWFEAELSLAPAPPRAEAPATRSYLPLIAGLGLLTVALMTTTLIALVWLLPF